MVDPGKDTSPVVSVVIPTYNRAHSLARAINSVLKQTFSDFELLIVDDFSEDETASLVKDFKDPRIRYFRLPRNSGPSAARNEGLRHSKGNFCAFLDSDDEYYPEKLEKQYSKLKSLPLSVGAVYCDAFQILPDGSTRIFKYRSVFPGDGLVYKKALGNYLDTLVPQALMVRKECLEKVGYFDENIRRFEDLELLIRITKVYELCHMPEPLFIWHRSLDTLSHSGLEEGIFARRYIFDKFIDDYKKIPSLYANRCYWFGNYYFRNRRTSEGRSFLMEAFRHNPRNSRYFFALLLSFTGRKIFNCVYSLLKKRS